MFNVLPTEDIRAITGKVRPHAQRTALQQMRIPFALRPDGTPVVSIEAANKALGVHASANDNNKITLDLDAI